MRIAIDYTPAVRQGAGIGRHTRGLVQALPAGARNHAITLLVFGKPSGHGAERVPPGCRLRTVPIPQRWLTIAWHRLRLPLPVHWFSGPVDLYHAPDFVLPPVGRRTRTLLTVHDLSFLTVPEHADPGLRAFLGRVVPDSVRRADHVLADSASTRDDLVRLLAVPPERITVVYPGVENRFRPVEDAAVLAEVRRRYGIGAQPFILGVGTLEPRKNWPGLIRAWTRLRQATGLPHRLVLAGGRGWLDDEIFRAARESTLQEEIVFAGFVADADLPALYSAASAFAFPSFYEGFGIPVVEALACGTPTVCADNSSLPEAGGAAALFVQAGDEEALAEALRRLLEDRELRVGLRERGLAQASRFTWEASAARLLAIYERVGHA